MTFRNPSNGYTESMNPLAVGVWALLFGCLYFAAKGIWFHAVIGLILALITYGASWLIYPFFAPGIVRTHYLRKGWVELA